MMNCSELVTSLNQQKIKAVVFAIDGYGHYRQCQIGWDDDKVNIVCKLTPDGKETIYFAGAFNPDSKIFYFGHQTGRTLHDVWRQVIIKDILKFTEN